MIAPDERKGPGEEILARVRGLPREIEPPADLWRDIAAALRPDAAPRAIRGPDRAWGFASGLRRRGGCTPPWPPRSSSPWARPCGSTRGSGPGWRVEATAGRPSLTPSAITTDAASTARLAVGRHRRGGRRARLPRAAARGRAAEHRLALDVGAIQARISAPPRLFVVETPSATAVDLGCQYTLAVDPRGGGLIHVTVGWVELRGLGRTSVVPFNMSAYTRPGFAPGTPFADRAGDSLKAALYRFDFERGGESALRVVARRRRRGRTRSRCGTCSRARRKRRGPPSTGASPPSSRPRKACPRRACCS